MAEAQAEPNFQGGPECTATLSETCADRPACRDERLIGVAYKSGTGARLDDARILSLSNPLRLLEWRVLFLLRSQRQPKCENLCVMSHLSAGRQNRRVSAGGKR